MKHCILHTHSSAHEGSAEHQAQISKAIHQEADASSALPVREAVARMERLCRSLNVPVARKTPTQFVCKGRVIRSGVRMKILVGPSETFEVTFNGIGRS